MEGDIEMNLTINSLDPSQRQVLESLIAGNKDSDISVVYGPPGTGKSHLIVSLLFELATRKNKVLFVSQNTEALEVISRMITKLEREMRLGSDHVSLLDFCLMLNRTEQRRLKYIKSQRDRIYTKELKPAIHIEHKVDMENAPYNLVYTHLDKNDNENVPEDTPLGMDELLANYLHNVENTNILGSTVKSLSNIDIRRVFTLLKNYKDEYDNFSSNNHPTNCLKFISKNNLTVTLPGVHASIDMISRNISKLDDDTLNSFRSQYKTDVLNFVQLLSKIDEAQKHLNLYRVQTDSVDLGDMSQDLANAIELFESLENVDVIDLPDECDEELFTTLAEIDMLNSPKSMDALRKGAAESLRRVERIKKTGISPEHYYNVILSYVLIESDFVVLSLANEFPEIKKLDDAELLALIKNLEKWDYSAVITRFPELKTLSKDALEDFVREIRKWKPFKVAESFPEIKTTGKKELSDLIDCLEGWDPAKLLTKFPKIKEFTKAELTDLLSEISEWQSWNIIQKKIKKPENIYSLGEEMKPKDVENLAGYAQNLKNILDITKQVSLIKKDAKVEDAERIVGRLDELKTMLDIIRQVSLVKKDVKAEDIESITEQLSEVKAILDIIEQVSLMQKDIKVEDVEYMAEHLDELKTIFGVIKDSTLNIGLLENLMADEKKFRGAINPLRDAVQVNYLELLNDLLVLKANSGYFCNMLNGGTIGEIEANCNKVISDISKYDKILRLNPRKAGQDTTTEFIDHTNRAIRNKNKTLALNPIVSKYGKYLNSDTDNAEDFIGSAKLVLDDIRDNKVLGRALDFISLTDENAGIDAKNLDSLLSELTASLDAGVFSDEFYEVKPGDNLTIWSDRIKTIRNFANIDELDGFVAQNQFIYRLKELMGKDNSEDIDEYLKNDPLTYADFSEKITTDLVKAKYQSLSPTVRKKISSKQYLKTYQKELSEERENYFLAGLEELKLATEDATKRLKYDSNWEPARSVMERIRANSEMIIDAFPIVIATPKEVSKYLKAKKAMFDYVVFDEASQLLPGQALPSIYRAEKAIIVGDPHQMPPTLSTNFAFDNFSGDYDEDEAENDNSISILDIAIPLADAERQYHLKVHYRSESNKLFEPSCKAIYAADGIQPIFEAKSDKMPIAIKDDLGLTDADNFSEISRRVVNKIEDDPNATFCLLFTRKDASGEAGFKDHIARNQAANQIIYDLMESGRLLISTITNCQGIQGDHSIIYFNHYENPGAMWFFNEKAGAYKRLNVAITRQRKSLDILMADPRGKWLTVCQNFTQPGTSPNRLKSAELMLSLLTSAGQEVDENSLEELLGQNATNIDSPLTQELYDKLVAYYDDRLGSDIKIWCEVGWNMLIPDMDARKRNRKNVGFRLDIGIYSPKKKRFVLGIEMDGAMYHSGYVKEFADQQRQEILEMKGWQIYRIWSTNWLNDTEAEFKALVAEIDRLLDEDDSYQDTPKTNYGTYTYDTPEKAKPVRMENGSINKADLIKYLKRHELDGTPIEIKYLRSDMAEKEAVFRKMFIESLTDSYMLASFDEFNSKSYKYHIDKIIDYR